MSAESDELVLLERVFFRLGSADTDEQLQNVVSKFLTPVLLKLGSQELVRKKVMELLAHVNKRVKCRPLVQLPVQSLLVQYQDPAVSSFVINFTIIYIKMGFPRLPINEQVDLIPVILNSLEGKPLTQQQSLLLLIIPLLGDVKFPMDPQKRSSMFGLNEKPQISKLLSTLLLDMLLLPYGALPSSANQQSQSIDGNVVSNTARIITGSTFPVPAGMSDFSFNRLTKDNFFNMENLEHIKLGIVKFLANDIFPHEDVLIHFIVAAADTRFSIANLADMELKKVGSCIDWSTSSHTSAIYGLFLGTMSSDIKQEMKKRPANTRIRLKLLQYLCRIIGDGFLIPPSMHVIFDALFSTDNANTNNKLKTLALQFCGNIIKQGNKSNLTPFRSVLSSGLRRILNSSNNSDEALGFEVAQQGLAFYIAGVLGERFPADVYHDVGLLELYFQRLASNCDTELKLQVREGLLRLLAACRYDVIPEECDKDNRLSLLFGLVEHYINSEEVMARFVTVIATATLFPPQHPPSKLLLLLATEDCKDTVQMEALKALYGPGFKNIQDLEGQSDSEMTKLILPGFENMVKYVYDEANKRVKDKNKKVALSNLTLPFSAIVYAEILIYLRLCLIQNLNIAMTREASKHPTEITPIIKKYLLKLFNEGEKIEGNSLLQYLWLIQQLLKAAPSSIPISCLLEIIGCIPKLNTQLSTDTHKWLKNQLFCSMKEEVREHSALLFAIISDMSLTDQEFDDEVMSLITQVDNNKMLEAQHGAILALGFCLERKIIHKTVNNVDLQKWSAYNKALELIVKCLKSSSPLILSSACTSIGLISRVSPLPIPNDGSPFASNDIADDDDHSPNAKRPATVKTAEKSTESDNMITKMGLVNLLLDLTSNGKLSVKCREKAARSLGLLCVGERGFEGTRDVLQGLLNTAKETKDVEVHLTIGESLVMSVLNINSAESRDAWSITEEEFTSNIKQSETKEDNDNAEWLVAELLRFAHQLHPNIKQASCIWLLAVLKHCAHLDAINKNLNKIQNAFMNLLAENNDIVQDVASKGLCLIYDHSKSEELLNSLVDQLTSGRRQVAQVDSDTKLFEEGQLGQTPTGGKLTTYKELCSLASDLNKPDMIYQFMHLANHNAVWNSKKGAAFGFSNIAQKCGENLKLHLHKIVPKLYIYQYDPNPNIQMSMQNIWHTLVPETQKTLDTYHNEILAELLSNLTSNQYRVRQSCCLALQDFLKGSGNRSIHDSIHVMEELWNKLFRVMDDHHEATRTAAIKTTKVLSKLCIRGCDITQGKLGVKLTEAILPVLLNKGITNEVAEVRIISLQTVSELVGSAGKQLKPFLGQLIPALLQATGELESTKMSYLSTMFGAHSQAQEALDNARASSAKSHFTTETVSKCLQYMDASTLEELVPKVVDLMKGSVGLGSRIASAHFISLLVIQVSKLELQPYTGKLLAALVNGLTDRNAAIRKHYASAIGHLAATAKDSSLEKLFAKLNTLYFDTEDNGIRQGCAYTIHSIGIHSPDVFKSHSETILPLVFFAMHAPNPNQNPNNSYSTVASSSIVTPSNDTWSEIWSEHSPGNEAGIRRNIQLICEVLKKALESPKWTMKSQAANCVRTIANTLGTGMEREHRKELIGILLNGLSGRTWDGKDMLLRALASICVSCKEILKHESDNDLLNIIIESVLKECRKEEISYKIVSLQSLGDILQALQVDRFHDVYVIAESVLSKDVDKDDDNDDDDNNSGSKTEKREKGIKLRETVYEVLGKAWPDNSATTQEKYRDQYIDHCTKFLPTYTRNIQNAIVSSLCLYVEKLDLLATDRKLNEADEKSLKLIMENLIKVLDYSFGMSRNTRLRKEALNVLIALVKKLQGLENVSHYSDINALFNLHITTLTEDNQPEIKSRVVDLKRMLTKK